MRRVLLLAIAAMFCCVFTAIACGDKFLIIGRGAGYRQRYVAIHPATNLLFGKRAAGNGDVDVKRILERAGHHVDYAGDEAALDDAVHRRAYDIVITSIDAVGDVERRVHAAGPQPLVVPILFASNENEMKDVEKRYECIGRSTQKNKSFLTVLDDAMAARLRGDAIHCKWSS